MPRVRGPILIIAVLLAPTAGRAAPDGIESPPEHERISGTDAAPCEWPGSVMLIENPSGTLCSATMLHPRLAVTAAHCGFPTGPQGAVVFFGEVQASSEVVFTERCEQHPGFTGAPGGPDVMYCLLEQEVDIPIAPPVMGCEVDRLVPGAQVTVVGWGDPVGGTKGWIETSINSGPSGYGIGLGGTCSGDSGGSAYIRLDDGAWHAFGVVSGGSGGCPGGGLFSTLHPVMDWLEQSSGLDLTPCHDADGTWNPGPSCTRFPTDLDSGAGKSWADMCAGAVSGPSATCGEPIADDHQAPQVRITSPGDRSEFAEAPATIDIVVEADDPDGSGVASVVLQLNGMLQDAADTSSPFEFTGVAFPRGVWEIVAVAEDRAGNVGQSEPVVIAVADELPPDASTGGGTGTDGGTGDDSGWGPLSSGGLVPEDDRAGCDCRARSPLGGAAALPWLAALLAVARRRRG